MDLNIVSYLETPPRRMQQYYVSGQLVVGAFGNEGFGIELLNDHRPAAVRIAVDGRDVTTGQMASPDHRNGVQLIALRGHETKVVRNWIQHRTGGRELVFGEAYNSVGSNVPTELVANPLGGPGRLTVAVYHTTATSPVWKMPHTYPPVTIGEIHPQPNYRERRTRGTRSAEPTKSFGAGEGFATESPRAYEPLDGGASGVGAGDYIAHTPINLADPAQVSQLRLTQVLEVRHMWYSELVELLEACRVEPPVQQYADLGSAPYVPSAGSPYGRPAAEPPARFPRFV